MSISNIFLKQLCALNVLASLFLSVYTSHAGIVQTIRNIPSNKYVQMGLQGTGIVYCFLGSHYYKNLSTDSVEDYARTNIYDNMRNIHRFGALICIRELYNTYYRPSNNQTVSTTNTPTPNAIVEQTPTPSTVSISLTPANDSNTGPSPLSAPISSNNDSVQASEDTTQTPMANNTTVTESSRWQRLTTMTNNACQHVQNRFSGEKSAKVAQTLRFAQKWGWIGMRIGAILKWPSSACLKKSCYFNKYTRNKRGQYELAKNKIHRNHYGGCGHCWLGRAMVGMAIQSLYNQYYGDTNNSSTVAKETNSAANPSATPEITPESKQPALLVDPVQNTGSPNNNDKTAA